MAERETTGYNVHLRRNADDLIRTIHINIPWEEHHDFWWTEGNFACDCNRELEFEHAAGNKPGDTECGDSRFTAIKAVLPDGTEIALDDDDAR